MFLPAPLLDDTRWRELVEEGRALIPLYAPEWTDHNLSDPGITFAELFAWLAEMQVFQVDQVPDRHRRKFLALVGVEPAPPRPARTVVRFASTAAAPLAIPATLECEGLDPAGDPIRVRTLAAVTVVAANVVALRSRTAAGVRDLTGRWSRGEDLAPFGEEPQPGDTFELALDAALPAGVTTTVFLTCATDRAGAAERSRLREDEARRRLACRAPWPLVCCDEPAPAPEDGPTPSHHSVRVAWEALVEGGRWQTLRPAAGEVGDDTRSLTLDGAVAVALPRVMHAVTEDDRQRYLLRCRLVAGAYDEAPRLRDVALNGVAAEQSVPAVTRWPLAPDAIVTGTPEPGRTQHLGVEIDDHGAILRLDVTDESAPPVLVLGFGPSADDGPTVLTAELGLIGRGTGAPEQTAALAPAPVDAGSLVLWSGHGSTWRRWAARRDLDASGPADAHLVLDAAAGEVRFGDGMHGLVPAAGELIVAAYRSTLAQAGNASPGTIDRVADDDHNRALASPLPPVEVRTAVAMTGGTAAETLEHAEGRAGELANAVTRAVTLNDYERLALGTPGVRLARAAALANLHPGFPCVTASGVVTVIVVPHLPAGRPVPSAGVIRAVAVELDRRRLIGTRVEVTGPAYTEVGVRARVRALPLADPPAVQARVVAALDAFLDPLHGGPGGAGWPFGRDVVRSEVLQAVDAVAGVDHVLALDLIGPDGASCGNLCIGPLGLVTPADHEIEVVRG